MQADDDIIDYPGLTGHIVKYAVLVRGQFLQCVSGRHIGIQNKGKATSRDDYLEQASRSVAGCNYGQDQRDDQE